MNNRELYTCTHDLSTCMSYTLTFLYSFQTVMQKMEILTTEAQTASNPTTVHYPTTYQTQTTDENHETKWMITTITSVAGIHHKSINFILILIYVLIILLMLIVSVVILRFYRLKQRTYSQLKMQDICIEMNTVLK